LILIVEDDKSSRESLAAALDDLDLPVKTVACGDDAQVLLKSYQPKVIITDLMMKPGNGVELAKHVSLNYPEIAVILVTAFGNSAMAAEVMSYGAVACVEKPIDLDKLEEALERALSPKDN
jgi:DNA-binding NtrC family response regulator